MRKLKLFLSVLMLMAFSVGNVWGAVESGTTYNLKGSFPTGWSGTNTWNGTSYFYMTEAANYVQTDEFCQNGFTSIKVKARKYGGPASGQEVVTVSWVEKGGSTTALGTITPTTTSLADYTISKPAAVTGNKEGYIKITASPTAASSKGAGISEVTISYTAGSCAAADPYTVSFSTGAGNPGVDPIAETAGGAGITLPAGPTPACSETGWSFAGWATAAVASETTVAPALLAAGASYKPTSDCTLYAVYKRTETGEVTDQSVKETFENQTAESEYNKTKTYEASASNAGLAWTMYYGCVSTDAKLTGNQSAQMRWYKTATTTYGYIQNTTPISGLQSVSFNAKANNANSATTKISVWYSTDGDNWTQVKDNEAAPTSTQSITAEVKGTVGTNYYIKIGVGNNGTAPSSSSTKLIIDDVQFNYKAGSSTNYYLSAPSCCTKHAINIAASIPFGKVEADLAEACEGTVVTLSTTPNEHCRFVEWDVKQGETPVSVSDSKFTMPDGDVTVSAVFAEIKNAVKVSDPEHGTINVTGAANLDEVLEGTELEVSVTGSGYKFTLDAYKYGETGTKVTITDGKLTMPAYDIVITANEEKLVSPTILVSKSVIDFGKAVKAAAAPAAETFTISGSNLTGDLALAWDESDAYFAWEVTEGNLTATAGVVTATISVSVTAKGMSTAGMLADNLVVSGGGADQQEVLVGVEVQETYTAKWYVNGEELTESTQTSVAGTDLIVPTNPTELADDCDDMVFKGWAEAAIVGKQDDAPTYTTKTKMPEADVNFYAVFASEVPGKDVTIQDHITPAVVGKPSSYTDWTGKTATSSAVYAGTSTGGDSYIQIRTNDAKSGVVSTTSGGKVTKITVAWNSSTVNGRKLNVYGKNTAYESSTDLYSEDEGTLIGTIVYGTSTELTISNDYAYIGFRSNEGAMYLDEVVIDWKVPGETTYTDYMTTCPTCQKVTLVKAGETNGSLTIKEDGVEVSIVKTCEAAELTVDATPATGYELTDLTISGVAGAAYNAGVISIPQDVAGTLTVTATFTAINYTVTMEQTGGAEAEISGNQENKHYGNEITVTAGEKAGYYFLGWEADVEVAFANAKALTTTFPMPASNVKVTAKYAKIMTVTEAIPLIPNKDDKYENAVVMGYISAAATSDKAGTLTYNVRAIDANGFLTGSDLLVFRGKGLNGANFSNLDDVEVGAKVLIYGQLKNYEGTREFSSTNYLLSYDAPGAASVVVYGEAEKTYYEYGDPFQFDGLKAKQLYKNGYATEIETPEWSADPAAIIANGEVTATATWNLMNGSTKVGVEVLMHEIDFNASPENGTLVVTDLNNTGDPVADGAKFVKDDELKIEAFAAAGYKLETLTVNGADFTNGDTYKVGTEDIVIVATFVKDSGTAIDNTEASVKAVKLIENGVLIIRRGDKSFNAQGQLIR